MVPVEGDVRREVLVSLRRQHGFVAGLRSRLRSFPLFFWAFSRSDNVPTLPGASRSGSS